MGASLYEPINVYKPIAPDIGIVDGTIRVLDGGWCQVAATFHYADDGRAPLER